MLSEFDDYFIHQIPTTIDHVGSSDSSWRERNYFSMHAKGGDSLIVCGMSMTPNSGRLEIYTRASYKGRAQINLSWNRELKSDRHILAVGPFSYTILEPLKRWRIKLDDNPSLMSFDLIYSARHKPWEFKPIFWRRGGRVIMDFMHFQQSGYYEGCMAVDGEPVDLAGFYGQRDRTWGVRRSGDLHIWMGLQFDDFSVAAWLFEDANGKAVYTDGGFCYADEVGPPFVKIEHDIKFEEGTKYSTSAQLLIMDETGQKFDISVRPLGPAQYFGDLHKLLGGNMEATAQGVRSMGEDPKRNRAERWDYVEDRPALQELKKRVTIYEQFCEFRMGDKTGYGVFELLMTNYKRYGITRALG